MVGIRRDADGIFGECRIDIRADRQVATASNKAFSELDWSNDIVPALLSQRENTVNLPQLPGGYYVTRGIEQAYWNVVEQNANPTDTLIKWGDIVNNEMIRKKAEYE